MNHYIFIGLPKPTQRIIAKDQLLAKCNHIIDKTCDYFNLHRDKILTRGKTTGIAKARMISIYLCSKDYSLPLMVLSDLFHRDHSTIIYNRDECANWMWSDKDFRALVEEVQATI